jgi:hypothetical protein
MTKVDGVYDCVTKTPLGNQNSVLTIVSDGDRFQGTNAGMLGSLDLKNGKVDGSRLSWSVDMVAPMPMTLNCEAVVEGDAISGTIDAGAFGKMAMTGTRRG